jgi:hypothetical protein
MANTVWVGQEAMKLYLQSGDFTSTLKTSVLVSAWETLPEGASWDGVNTPWTGRTDNKLYLISGKFTSTLKTSEDVQFVDNLNTDISADRSNTPWIGWQTLKMFLSSGQFTSTIKDSYGFTGIEAFPTGISCAVIAGIVSTPWCGREDNMLYVQSGQFTSTMKVSLSISGPRTVEGIGWNGTDTLWTGSSSDKLFRLSGQITSTVRDSESVTSIDNTPNGLESDDFNTRVGEYLTGDVDITLPFITMWSVSGGIGSIAITLPFLTMYGVEGGTFGDIAIILPSLTLIARTYTGTPPSCLVMNTKNFAVSEYDNFGFNSMTKFNGSSIVADQNGIYEIDDSDLDAELYKIKCHATTGIVDTYDRVVSRMRDAYLTYRGEDDVKLSVYADKNYNRHYEILRNTVNYNLIKIRRVKFERGIKNRHFDFRMANIDGGALEIEKLKIALEPILSKRR